MTKMLLISFDDESGEVSDIVLMNENGEEIRPEHSYFFQDLIEDLNHSQVYERTIKKYGDIDESLFSVGL